MFHQQDVLSVKQCVSSEKSKVASKRARKMELTGWLMGGWPFLGSLLFGLFPLIISCILPFFELKSFYLPDMKFVGFDNFKYLFTNQYSLFWIALGNSFYYTLSVPVSLIISLFVAVQLDKHVRGAKVFRVIMFLPTFVSSVAITMMWKFFFEGNYGVLNSILGVFGIKPIDWLNTKATYMPSVIFTTTWSASANCVLFQAALANVNQSMKEAAAIDGASSRKIFFKITLPAISPTTFYQLVMSLIGALQVFTQLQLLSSNGTGPDYAALSMVYYIYSMAFTWTVSNGLGVSSACAVVFTLLIIALTVVVFKTKEKWVYDME